MTLFNTLPAAIDEQVRGWTWQEDIQPYFEDLQARELTPQSLDQWLADWSAIGKVIYENFSRAQVATTQDTADEAADNYYKHLLDNIRPQLAVASNKLNQKLVASGLVPDNFEIPLKKMQTEIDIFREENLPLFNDEQKVGMEYSRISSAQTITWNGEELTLPQVNKIFQSDDRDERERAWHLSMNRRLEDRDAINTIWTRLFTMRQQMAHNAGFDNYRAFRWAQMNRFDYTPDDCLTFHAAIEEVVVPAAKRANERRRQRLGLATLRPWDLTVDPTGQPALQPWQTIDEFADKAGMIFNKVDPKLGGYYATMRDLDLFDLPNRKNKRPGAYCTNFPLLGKPFVFMNAVGTRDDVRTLLHECGHAFHNFEAQALPYVQQRSYPIEFAEVASMAMELLAAPYLVESEGGYFNEADAARDRIAHLEKILFFWPYMAVVDSFQHWAYSSGNVAADPAACDAKWSELWDRFQFVDYSGFEDVKATGWHRKQHIFRYPFYYIEYGLAELGAVQVWANARQDQAQAVAHYREALALGGTGTLPQLFGAAGAKFAFDAATLGDAVALIEGVIDELSQSVPAGD